MRINIKKSPNFDEKLRKNKDIKFVIFHYTGMQSKRVSLSRLLSKSYKVSSHYFIDLSGSVTRLVNDNQVAWHAGKSKWQNFVDLNKNSIGIELQNKGHDIRYEKFSKKQINQLIKLCLYLKKKYRIKKTNFLGHSDIAPLRKKDPGEKFPWIKLSKKGIGMWYPKNLPLVKLNNKKIRNFFFQNIYKIGYRYFKKKVFCKNDKKIIKAFKRRYMPKKVNSIIDKKTLIVSHYLAKIRKN